jgi:hypothetical protein
MFKSYVWLVNFEDQQTLSSLLLLLVEFES